MELESRRLLGKYHLDTERFATDFINDSLAIGITPVITEKKHNWGGNEDACGINQKENIRMGMVADAHWGYVASQEAVLRFPDIFFSHYETHKDEKDPRQIYLESIIELCDNLDGVGRKSNVSYRTSIPGMSKPDSSVSQFYSVVNAGGNYYFVGLGDCVCHIITPQDVTRVNSQNDFFGHVGSLSPRNFMRNSNSEGGLSKTDLIEFDNPLVRKGLDVQVLNVKAGDVIFMHSDGYSMAKSQTRLGPFSEFFNRRSLSEALDNIMLDVIQNVHEYQDNISVAVMKVSS